MSIEYIYSKSDVCAEILMTEIGASEAITKLCDNILFNLPNVLKIYFAEALSSSEVTALNTIVGDHTSLSAQKNLRKKCVDNRTQELIDTGFSFDGQQFSLSLAAQKNWLAIKTMQSFFTWPVSISTKNNGAYDLLEASLNAFVGAGLSAVQGHMNTGRILKVSIDAVSNLEELNAIVDNR